MIGDKLVITEYHRRAAAKIYSKLSEILPRANNGVAVTVAGESGCGKSETAAVLAELCEKDGHKSLILQQDDYFIYPPHTNHAKREEDINWVGMQEVKLQLMDENLRDIKEGNKKVLTKPLVIFDEDKITEEQVDISNVKVVIAEGTYTTTLQNADLRGFIDRDYRQTKKSRLARSRDPATEFLEKVLAIEHEIISKHKQLADIIIPPPPEEAGEGSNSN